MKVTVTKDNGDVFEWTLGVPEKFMDSAVVGVMVVNDQVTVNKDGKIDVDMSAVYPPMPKDVKITTSAAPSTPVSAVGGMGMVPNFFWRFLWGKW